MLEIVIIGLNHKTAPVALRECLAFNTSEAADGMATLATHQGIKEVLIFSTCNRVEILMTCTHSERCISEVKSFMAHYKKVPESDFDGALYVHKGDEAVRHIFRVAASLDSMMVGEPQILGQIKESFHLASRGKTTGTIMNRLLHRTFNVSKRIRTETGIGDSAVSISFAAVELGRKIFGSLEGKKVLLVGAGEMAELAVEHIIRHKCGDIIVANRTLERGVSLANKFGGQAVSFDEIADVLAGVDIVISSTGAPGLVIEAEHVKKVQRKRRNSPLFFIDIAVPRDIDPMVNKLENCYLYDIDDLKSVIDDNVESRQKEAIKAARIVDAAVISFRKWLDGLQLVPTIVDLKAKLTAIVTCETEKTLSAANLDGEMNTEQVARMTDAIVSKLMHDPIRFLKKTCIHNADDSKYLSLTRNLFGLDE